MDGIIYVSAPLYLSDKSNTQWKSSKRKIGFTPILQSDLYKFESCLNELFEKVNRTSKETSNKPKPEISESIPSNILKDENTSYQDLKTFLPISLSQQLHTFSIDNFPSNYTKIKLNSFFQWFNDFTMIKYKLNHDVIENWSFINGVEYKILFVRVYSNLKEFPVIVQYWDKLFKLSSSEKINLKFDANTMEFINDSLDNTQLIVEENDIQLLKNKIEEFGNNQIDDIEDDRYSIDYKVDVSTLSDLPKDSLNQLCKDITEFRTRVLTMEKEKLLREAYEHDRRQKSHMMKIFDQIKKSQGKNTIEDNEEEKDDIDGQDDDDNDDWELENRRQEKIKEQEQLNYDNLLKKFNSTTWPNLIHVKQQLHHLKNYEARILKERPLYLKELIHNSQDPYYSNKRGFKEDEEVKDAMDRKLATEEELDSTQTIQNNIEHDASNITKTSTHTFKEQKIKLAFKRVVDTKIEDENSETESEFEQETVSFSTTPNILPYDGQELADKLLKLWESKVVDELVKENLGVYEDELVDYIIENIQKYKDKAKLHQELKETFDEDSNKIVERIWEELLK